MCLEILRNQSLLKKGLNIELFRFFEKYCHLNLLDKILNESSCNFSCLIANPPYIYLGNFVILEYCPKVFSNNQIAQFSKFHCSHKVPLSIFDDLLVFSRLILYCKNSILYQKGNENNNNIYFLIKKKDAAKKV